MYRSIESIGVTRRCAIWSSTALAASVTTAVIATWAVAQPSSHYPVRTLGSAPVESSPPVKRASVTASLHDDGVALTAPPKPSLRPRDSKSGNEPLSAPEPSDLVAPLATPLLAPPVAATGASTASSNPTPSSTSAPTTTGAAATPQFRAPRINGKAPVRPASQKPPLMSKSGPALEPMPQRVRVAQAEVENKKPVEQNNEKQLTQDFEVIPQTGQLEVNVGRNLLLRTKQDIYRTAVVDPRVCEVIQFTPREVSIIGKGTGATQVTFWFRDGDGIPVTYLVKVAPDAEARRIREIEYLMLEDLLRKLYPDSKVYLTYVANKLIVRGQAKDIEEAAMVMTVIRGQANGYGGRGIGNNGRGLADGAAAEVLSPEETGRQARQRIQIINMLRVPGVQQVALRVKIAELNRTAARGLGIDVNARIDFGDTANGNAVFINSLLSATSGGAPALLAQFDGDDIQVGVNYLQQRGVVRLLSEPTVVTMSGQQATFHAGGEFAVPTVVGTGGLNAITTDFRSFGAVVSCLPTVVDKDRIRMQISPEFSQINASLSVGGTPGINSRSVTTTVEMREGQTLAIAGLLEDSMTANTSGNVPGLAWLFGNRSVSRNQTELIILVTPELVHPMEPDEVPPLPGFDVTEPTNGQFFLQHRLEGNPTLEYDSTIWPGLRHRYKAGGSAMISGPFGHGK